MIITTYGTQRNDAEMFKETKFHYIVLDAIAEHKEPIVKKLKKRFGLKSNHRACAFTGTPIENNTMELWSQFAFPEPRASRATWSISKEHSQARLKKTTRIRQNPMP